MPEGATRGVEGPLPGHDGGRQGALRSAAEAVVRRLRAREVRRAVGTAAVVQALESRTMLAADLRISEFMASNQRTLPHIDGNFYDWIEIHNAGDAPGDLAGYKLTDDANQLGKWTFPERVVGAGGYVVVFASTTRQPQPGELLADFELNRDGEYLALVSPTGAIVSQFAPKYPNQEQDISYGTDPDAGGKLRYFATPTPGARNARAEVVINEIHYDPDQKMEQVEFVELHNPGSAAVDLSGTTFSAGFTYTFPGGTILPAGEYLTLTQNQAQFQQKFGVAAFAQFEGTLSNEGERITLENRGGGTLDTVTYGAGFPWPTVGEAPGYSIELINADFDNDIGGNWRAVVPSTATETTLLPVRSTWKYFKGFTEASNPVSAWRQPVFPDGDTWSQGPGPIGYDEGGLPMGTPLNDMKNGYRAVFMRTTFQVDDPASITALRLEALYDDGFNVWINGEHVYTENLSGAELPYTADGGGALENNTYLPFSPKRPYTYLRQGTNTIAVQFHNSTINQSSDAYFDARLIAVRGGAGVSPTPGRVNSAYATNAAPQMRQVTHTPNLPKSNEAVTITTKVTDPEGVASVNLSYQVVDPGNYIPIDLLQGGVLVPNPAYTNPANWTSVAMRDDGTNGDATAGDGIYTVVLPPQLQQHRRLIRYRITASDNLGASITGPYADDPVPNFTYFVYDGVPAWQGADRPGVTPVQTYDNATLTSVPVFHLITQRQDHVNSQYLPGATMGQYGGDNYQWTGTLVYDGVVYDHIHYRARGGVWRYAMGKNMWKFDFNRNHEFQAKDEYGNPLATKWTKLNLGANIQQGNFLQRGEQGLFEHVGFKLFNLAGSATSKTAPIHFRIIENASQNGPTQSQYDDDFQGMYLAVEQLDGEFLDEHGMPDGNLYKMEGGTGELNNLGPTGPADKSDLNAFRSTLLSNPSEQWIRDNIDLDQYYGYRAMVEATHHWDIGFGKNYFWYRNPETGKWSQHAWDLDLTWTTTYEPGGGDNEPFKNAILSKPVFMKEYRNRLREIRDLLWNPEQVGRMLDDYAALVDKPGNSMVDADRAMWDYNPILVSGNVNASKAGHGKFYEATSLRTFRSFVDKLKQYVATRGAYIDNNVLTALEENAAPRKATVTYAGPAGYPEDQLRFNTSGFVAGTPVTGEGVGSFAAMEWRIADVTPTAMGTPQNYEIDAAWESGELTTFGNTITVPGTAVETGRTYRVRVRFKDSNGRWGHWSDAQQFVAGQGSSLVRDSLRVSEVHYNPAAPPAGSAYTNEDFEFIELKNIGLQQINLKGVEFGPGITYTFPNDLLVPAGGYVVLAKNPTALASRYAGIIVAGTYTGSLANEGEEIVLKDAAGAEIQRFTYDNNGTGWHASTDGDGYSLTIVDEGAALAEWSEPRNWRPSAALHGTPGGGDSAIAPGTIIINEIATHRAGGADWIELRNTKATPMSVGGWFLSDDPADLTKYRISGNRTIAGNGYLVLTALDDFGTAFALDELLGGRLYLSNADGQFAGSYRESVDYGASAPGVTIGWHAHGNGSDFTELASATLGAANAGPAIGPVVINEIMYNPLTIGASEYIELRNLTGAAVKLYDPANPQNTWQFTDGIAFSFPQGAEIPAFGYVLVVPTDPAAFRQTNNIHPNVPVFGPYTGNLGNGGEKVTLSRPGTPMGLTVPYYRVDRVEYGNGAPWPTAPDGTGPALSRTNSGAYGNDAANWSAEQPAGSMGRENFDVTAPTVSIPEVDPGPVDSVRIIFSELVRGFDLADLQLTRDGVNVPLSAAQTLTSNDGLTYVLGNVGQLTSQAGDYVLRVVTSGGVRDLAERPLTSGATRSFTVAASGLGLNGTNFNDNWYLKRVGEHISVWNNADGSGTRVSDSAMGISFALNALDGDDTVTIDLAGGNIEFGEFVVTGSNGDDVIRVINGGGKVLTVGAMPALGGERLDLGEADLTVVGASVAAVEGLLKTARDGATRWEGPGIGTSAATSLTGLMAMQQGADVLVKLTYNGDANGDARVNADDYFRIDQSFLGQPANPLYAQGDFNYDDAINADDYFMIDQAFLGQGAPLAGTATVAASAAVATTTTATVEEPKKAVRRTRVATSLFSDVRVRGRATARR